MDDWRRQKQNRLGSTGKPGPAKDNSRGDNVRSCYPPSQDIEKGKTKCCTGVVCSTMVCKSEGPGSNPGWGMLLKVFGQNQENSKLSQSCMKIHVCLSPRISN